MSIVTLPEIYVTECDEVTMLEDTEHECLEIAMGAFKIIVFATNGMPVVLTIKERETP